MKIAIIIPARGGSKGIPQKNIKFLNSKPLIYYSIKNALSIDNADVYVSTDSKDIAHISSIFGAKILMRNKFADDTATLDDVTYYEIQKLKNKEYDLLITLQPTSPLLKKKTLENALKYFIDNNLTSLISASKFTHLSWKKENSNFKKMYEKRVNRQQLEPIYVENGAFVICKISYLLENKTRISENVEIYPIDENESIDIDNKNDWVLAENILKRKNIAFITNGSIEIGMGHIYRCLNLANKFNNDEIFFYCHKNHHLGIEKIKSLNYRLVIYDNETVLINYLIEDKIDIVINDFLNTDIEYMKKLKENNFFIINFEDTSLATNYANIVINALYEWSNTTLSNSYFGYKYEVLREDIYLYDIKRTISSDIKNLLIGFGGTDINNATLKVLKSIQELNLQCTITLILGIGYQHEKELYDYINEIKNKEFINIIKDVKFISDYIYKSDLVISGNGRMVYEIVALGIPLIVISQNEREMSHIFPKICKGISYLGYVNNVNENDIKETVALLSQKNIRETMHEDLKNYAKEIRKGANTVVSIINEKYIEFKNENI